MDNTLNENLYITKNLDIPVIEHINKEEELINKEYAKELGISGTLTNEIRNSLLYYNLFAINNEFYRIRKSIINYNLIDIENDSCSDVDEISFKILENIKEFFEFISNILKSLRINLPQFTEKLIKFIEASASSSIYYKSDFYERRVRILLKDLDSILNVSYIYGYIDNDELKNMLLVYKELNNVFINIISTFDNFKTYLKYSTDTTDIVKYLENEYNSRSISKDMRLYDYLIHEKNYYKERTTIREIINNVIPSIRNIDELKRNTNDAKKDVLYKIKDQLNYISVLIETMEQISDNILSDIGPKKYNISSYISDMQIKSKEYNNRDFITKQIINPINVILSYIKKLVSIITNFIMSYTLCINMFITQFNTFTNDYKDYEFNKIFKFVNPNTE